MPLPSRALRSATLWLGLIAVIPAPVLAQEDAASPFGAAPLSADEAARPAAPIRPATRLPSGAAAGNVGDLDSYAEAGNAGFSTSRRDITQDIGLAPVIQLLTPKVTTKGGGF